MNKSGNVSVAGGGMVVKCLTACALTLCIPVLAETVIIQKNPLTGEVRKFDRKAGRKNVQSVARQLSSLLVPSKTLKNLKAARHPLKPYSRVVAGPDGKSTLIYRCRYTQSKSLVNSMESAISPVGTVEYSSEQNLIIINDKSEKIKELKGALEAIDIPSPQVLVEAKIVEILLNDGMERNFSLNFNQVNEFPGLNDKGDIVNTLLSSSGGVETSVPGQTSGDRGLGFNWFPYVSGNKNINASIQWLLTAQDAKILSSPNVVVSRNATASIVTGQDIPIQTFQIVSGSTTTSTEFKRVGVILNVTPKLINRDSVTLGVNPQVSNVLKYIQFKQDRFDYEVPVISIRNIETDLTLKDGQVIMLGGLYSHRETLQQERTPFLSDIPVIGEFFTAKNRSKELIQLIFFLKVNILTEDEIASGVIYDPGKQAVDSKKLGSIIRNSKQIFPAKESTLEKVKKEFIEKDESYR